MEKVAESNLAERQSWICKRYPDRRFSALGY